MKKTALVLGAGGFIGSHLVKDLKSKGYWVRGVDIKFPEFSDTEADDFIIGDLRDPKIADQIMKAPNQSNKMNKSMELEPDPKNSFDEVYQLAADMGGAGFVFSGDNDADIMHNSALINLNITHTAVKFGIKKIFYSSSACIYPEGKQTNTDCPSLKETDAYPASPDSEYGWEKLFSERLFLAFRRNHNLDVRIARFHNIFGPQGTWAGGREKAPAAMCRKVLEAIDNNASMEIWGDGEQTRSFLYIDECLKHIRLLMDSDNFYGPVNIGSDELISINNLAKMAMKFADKEIEITHIPGPLGVRGRNSDNTLINKKLGSSPKQLLIEGMKKTFNWIKAQRQAGA
jgi:GDP-D-mannose 3', 5'-epimerase